MYKHYLTQFCFAVPLVVLLIIIYLFTYFFFCCCCVAIVVACCCVGSVRALQGCVPAPSCYFPAANPSSIITTCSSTLSRRCRMRFLCWLHLILNPSLTAWSLRMTGIVINLSNSQSFGHSRQSSSVAITSVRFLFLFFFAVVL